MKLIEGDSEVMGLKTGYETLDRAIIGLRPGEMFVLAARPSIGKTALALNMACYIALNSQVPVGIFSLEMPAQQLVNRMICSEARVPMSKFTRKTLTQVEMTEVLDAGERLRKSHIIIDDTGGIDILELKAKARRMRSRHDVGVIFIDYLQLIQTDAGRNASRENEVSKISGSIKALAKELGIPIVILAQLNRQAEQGEKPKLSHLRESGAIEQDADVVALLHRDREKQYQQKMDDETGIDSELIIAKNRNGATGTQELLFFPSYTRFYNKSRVSDQDIDSEANA
jgi:replicative DNA helicase